MTPGDVCVCDDEVFKHRGLRGACLATDCDCKEVRLANENSTTGHTIDPNGVNHPKHYNLHPAGIECIDVVEHMPFNVGIAIKHLWRAGLKDGEPSVKDLD